MPSYNFTNQENKIFEPVPAGDYILEVVKCEFGIVASGNSSGSEKMELTLQVEGKDTRLFETLTFSEKAAWKIDTFVKACNLLIDGKPPVLNQPIDFTEPMVVGLRGWATLFVDEYQGKKRNKVRVWITNKEKLAKRAVETDVADPDFDDDAPPF